MQTASIALPLPGTTETLYLNKNQPKAEKLFPGHGILTSLKSHLFISVIEGPLPNQDGDATITFRLTPGFEKHFSLLRGLLAFGSPKDFSIIADKETKTFTVRLHAGGEPDHAWMDKVLGHLKNEIVFRKTLRIIIAEEQKIKEKIRGLYDALRV